MLAVNINHLWNEPLKFNKQLFRFLALSIRRGNFQANFVSAAVNNCSLAIIPDLTRFLILIIPILGGSVTQFKVGTSLKIGFSKNHFAVVHVVASAGKRWTEIGRLMMTASTAKVIFRFISLI